MRKNRSFLVYAFLPIIVINLLQNLMSFFLVQMSFAGLAFTKKGILFSEMMDTILEYVTSSSFISLLMVSSGVACLIVFVFWYKKMSDDEAKGKPIALELNSNPKVMVIFACILIAFGCQFAGNFIVMLVAKISPNALLEYISLLDRAGMPTAAGDSFINPMLIIYTVLLAPVMEELAFRGISMKYALRSHSIWVANIICAMLFAMMHRNFLQGSYTFLFALLLGLIVAKTGKIWITILIHVLFNAFSAIPVPIVFVGDNPISSFLIFFTSMVAIYVGMTIILRPYKEVPQ